MHTLETHMFKFILKSTFPFSFILYTDQLALARGPEIVRTRKAEETEVERGTTTAATTTEKAGNGSIEHFLHPGAPSKYEYF
jgi:hypothetical protein